MPLSAAMRRASGETRTRSPLPSPLPPCRAAAAGRRGAGSRVAPWPTSSGSCSSPVLAASSVATRRCAGAAARVAAGACGVSRGAAAAGCGAAAAAPAACAGAALRAAPPAYCFFTSAAFSLPVASTAISAADRHLLALLGTTIARERAALERLHLHRGLVGLDLGDLLAGLDLVAFLLVPLDDACPRSSCPRAGAW